MTAFRDQSYLLNKQYKDASNFNARVALHARFSVNKHGWHNWVFDQFTLSTESTILELGCGPGWLWYSNRTRIPAGWQITLSDFSAGMLTETRHQLGEERFVYQVADAQALPFADASFDAVIANHMLYHVPDLPQGLHEIQRVLKPGGRLYASTIGRESMHELDELLFQAQISPHWQGFKQNANFVLENGQEVLAPCFEQVQLHTYEDALKITEAGPLIAYALSGALGQMATGEQRAALTALIEQELTEHGVIHMTKASGMFEAQRA